MTSTSNLLHTNRLFYFMGNKHIDVNLTIISSEVFVTIYGLVFSVCFITITLFIATYCSILICGILFLASHLIYKDIRSFFINWYRPSKEQTTYQHSLFVHVYQCHVAATVIKHKPLVSKQTKKGCACILFSLQ